MREKGSGRWPSVVAATLADALVAYLASDKLETHRGWVRRRRAHFELGWGQQFTQK